MTIWIDAQLSPAIAAWIRQNFSIDAVALRDIGLRDAEDEEIFIAAKSAGVVVMTKDADFLDLLDRHGAPPQIIWLTCGNTSNAHLKQILSATLAEAMVFLRAGERLIEVSDIQ
jgi:predicted nuclease of predicted toxin-antitoxin system